ncbi:MAG: hypothetical protein IJ857_01005, partial [Lachnospiraceae bacterium]|nr:hypothetical protein [Lachnospiraceae bacterium]
GEDMAYTRMHAIKATIGKSITYICNPEKTDGYRLISSFSCSRETAEFEFRSSLSKTPRKDGNLTELKAKFCEKSNEADNIRSELNAVGRELKKLKEIRHYLLQYKETAPTGRDTITPGIKKPTL